MSAKIKPGVIDTHGLNACSNCFKPKKINITGQEDNNQSEITAGGN